MRTAALVAVTSALFLATACEPADSPSDFASVLPDARVQINLPTELTDTARDAHWAEYYLLTAQVTDDVNGMIGGVLHTVDLVTEYPPTWSDSEDNTAVWGPWADSLDPVETVLWVHHDVESDEYTWAIAQRPRNLEDEVDFTPVIAGFVDAGATEEASSGYFGIDFDAAAALDPTVRERGSFLTEYDLAPEGVAATVGFEGFGEQGGELLDAWYYFEQDVLGDGKMDLAYERDVHENGSAAEVNLVRSRWLADGSGRSDVYVTDGELGELVATASQCWDNSFTAVYWTDNFSEVGEVGDAAACVYDQPEYNESDTLVR